VTIEHVEVAVVGGGPAGASIASRLAASGHEVVLLERDPRWRWRAGGVFASPAAVTALRRLGLAPGAIEAATRPIPAMRVETPGGVDFRLTYGLEPAVGFDRSRLDPALLDHARDAGADVRVGQTVETADLDARRLRIRGAGGTYELQARVVVGADGPRSIVAKAAGVARAARLPARLGLTYHAADERSATVDARMRLIRDGYIGIAPVPGGRVNVGIVLGPSWRAALVAHGAPAVAARIVAAIPTTADDPGAWQHGDPLDHVAGAWPLGHRVTRRAGPRWLLVGDAAGFLDPFTGEGLHRALVSAELASAAILARLRRPDSSPDAFGAFDRAMQRRFLAKDAVSWLVQGFLGHPAAFEYAARRVASRDAVRATMGLVMGDLVPATRALDPRYLARLLAP
jgi:flavin-dependent dehydrogenase